VSAVEVGAGPRLRRVLVGIGGTIAALVRRVVVEPVRSGRLRTADWPSGLAPVALVGVVAIVIAVVLTLASGLLRALLPLTLLDLGRAVAIPRGLDWLLFSLTALALALAMTGALHARAWLRWTMAAFSVLVMLFPSGIGFDGAVATRIVAIAASVLLVVFVAVRGGRTFRWWEFIVVGATIGGSLIVTVGIISTTVGRFGFDIAPSILVITLTTLGNLATPSAVAAGAVMAELAVGTAAWTVGEVRRRIGIGAVVVILVVVIAWRTADLVGLADRARAAPTLWTVYVVWATVLLGIVWAWMLVVRRIAPGGARASLRGVLDDLGGITLPIAALLTINVAGTVLTVLSSVLTMFGAPSPVTELLDAVYGFLVGDIAFRIAMTATGIGAIIVGLVLARRGRASIALLLLAVGTATLLLWIGQVVELPDRGLGDAIATLITLLGVGALVVAIVRRSRGVLASATTILLIAALYSHREVLADPVAAIIGAAGIGAVLFGQVWGFITGSGTANTDSPRYPRASRVLIVLGSTLFAITLLAASALWRDADGIIPFDAFARVGDTIFGGAVVSVAALVAVRAVLRDREIE
jgi:hypothetical protein